MVNKRMPKEVSKTLRELCNLLTNLDYDQLPISDYNKEYIARLKPAMHYYLNIYFGCFKKIYRFVNEPLTEWIVIDYGGGSGFLSVFAKAIGVKQVIYIDINPKSVETVRAIKEQIGTGPDVILEGDSAVLAAWCKSNGIKPHALMSVDVIEHIYDLTQFFSDLQSIHPDMEMIFTTASNPWNKRKCKQLYKMMKAYESGNAITPNYYTQRLNYISQVFPNLSDKDKDIYAQLTRGMIFKDIRHFVETVNTQKPDPHTVPVMIHPYNTCDPETGNFVERVLPVREYLYILSPLNFHILLSKGLYNDHQRNKLKSIVCSLLNFIIMTARPISFMLSPFIFLHCRRKPEK